MGGASLLKALRRLPLSAAELCLLGALALLLISFLLNYNARPMPIDGLAALGAMALIGFAFALERRMARATDDAAAVVSDSAEILEPPAPAPSHTLLDTGRSAGLIQAIRGAQSFDAHVSTRVVAGFDELSARILEEAQKSASSSVGQAQLSMRLIEAIQGVTKSINGMHGAIGDLHAKTQSMSSTTDAFSAVSDSIAQRARESKAIAHQTSSAVGAAGEVVASLQRATGRIGEVVTLINEITTKTHLLALNAGIEASRAGDAGRGFAVVAAEVQKLAAQTQDATTQIRQHIDNVQSAVDAVVTNVEKAKGNISDMEAVSDGVIATIDEQRDNIDGILASITAAVTGARDVHDAMEATKSEADTAVSLSDDVYMNSMTIESDADILQSVLSGALEQARDAALSPLRAWDGPFACLVSGPWGEADGRLRDLTSVGGILAAPVDMAALTPGTRLDVRPLSEDKRLLAVVCWAEGGGVRIRFETALTTEQLGFLLTAEVVESTAEEDDAAEELAA